MIRRRLGLLLLVMLGIVFCCWNCSIAEEQNISYTETYLPRYLDLLGVAIPSEKYEGAIGCSSAHTVTIGPVEVSLREVFYDGQTLLTSALVTPLNSDEVVVVPGGFEADDPTCGHYFVDSAADTRSYRQVAQLEGKQTVAVYAYIKEFDQVGIYFLDSYVRSDKTILLSGAVLAGGSRDVGINWLIQVYSVDVDTWQHDLIGEKTIHETVNPPEEYSEQEYCFFHEDVLPISSVYLAQTTLGTYLRPIWKDNEAAKEWGIYLSQIDNGKDITPGPSIIEPTYPLNGFPTMIGLTLVNWNTGVEERYTLLRDE